MVIICEPRRNAFWCRESIVSSFRDFSDLSQSWKMKRAFEQIEPVINSYLSTFTIESLKRINFSFKGKEYSSLAEMLSLS